MIVRVIVSMIAPRVVRAGRVRMGVGGRLRHVRGEPGPARRGQDGVGRSLGGIEEDLDVAGDQIELEVDDAGETAEGAPNQRGLVGAVHAVDVKAERGHLVERIFISLSTSSVWPGTFTLSQRRSTLPSGPMRYVVRAMPMNLRPYSDFSCQTPYFSLTA